MTIPAFLFGVLLSTLYGSIFHLFRGGHVGRYLLYLALAWVGFWIGQFVASQMNINLIKIGPLHLGIATITSWLFLGIGHWLSLIEIEGKNTKT